METRTYNYEFEHGFSNVTLYTDSEGFDRTKVEGEYNGKPFLWDFFGKITNPAFCARFWYNRVMMSNLFNA